MNAATPVIMPWLDQVDAVLWAGLPGQEGGHAVAAALLGDIEPAGRLVTTFPAEDGAAPAWSVTPVDGDLVYAEGTFIGYRGHYAGARPRPGVLVRARARLLDLGVRRRLSRRAGRRLGRSSRSTVTNTGIRESREVVQVYFEPADPDQPVRLVGWQACGRARAVRPVEVHRSPDVAPLGRGRRPGSRSPAPARCWWPAVSATSAAPSRSISLHW